MRRVIILMLLVLAPMNLLFAFTPHQNGTSDIELKAYYKGQNQGNKAVSLTIKDNSESSVYHGSTTTVTFSDTSQSTIEIHPVFSWTLTGNGFENSCSIRIKFTFKALMAYVAGNETYYVPEHIFTMSTPQVVGGNGSTISESNQASEAKKMNGFVQKEGPYQYYQYNDSDITNYITYRGTMVPDEGDWQVSGACNLDVTKYSKLVGIAFDYKGDIKVEFEVQ